MEAAIRWIVATRRATTAAVRRPACSGRGEDMGLHAVGDGRGGGEGSTQLTELCAAVHSLLLRGPSSFSSSSSPWSCWSPSWSWSSCRWPDSLPCFRPQPSAGQGAEGGVEGGVSPAPRRLPRKVRSGKCGTYSCGGERTARMARGFSATLETQECAKVSIARAGGTRIHIYAFK